jgi:hypothetical protein
MTGDLRARRRRAARGIKSRRRANMYRYEMIATNEENPVERQPVEITEEAVAIKTQSTRSRKFSLSRRVLLAT